jgi:hypothetical protein
LAQKDRIEASDPFTTKTRSFAGYGTRVTRPPAVRDEIDHPVPLGEDAPDLRVRVAQGEPGRDSLETPVAILPQADL